MNETPADGQPGDDEVARLCCPAGRWSEISALGNELQEVRSNLRYAVIHEDEVKLSVWTEALRGLAERLQRLANEQPSGGSPMMALLSKLAPRRILVRWVRRLACWWYGHDVDWSQFYTPCRYCEEALSYEQIGWPGFPGYLRTLWWRHVTRRWQKCPFCGLRNDRHTAECEENNIPF